MDIVLWLTIAACLGAGVAGGLISAWSCHRRMLVLEETFKLVVVSLEDRIKQLTNIAVRQDKSEAAKVRWSKKETDDHALLKQVADASGGSSLVGHPWDPRTWGRGG
jgi:hypothetical protein